MEEAESGSERGSAAVQVCREELGEVYSARQDESGSAAPAGLHLGGAEGRDYGGSRAGCDTAARASGASNSTREAELSVLQARSALFDGESWINTLQYGIVLADPDPDPDPPADPPADDPPPPPADDPPSDDPPEDPPADLPEPTVVAKPTAPDWRDKRIAQITARLRQYEKPGGPAPAIVPPTQAAAVDQAELDRLVEERATARAATAEFDRRCIAVVEEGQAEFPEFDARINNLKRIADFSSPEEAAQYNQFLTAALESGAPARVLHELGADLNEASRILQLSPIRMGIELARLADRLGAAPATSTVPKPPRVPAGGGGAGTEASHTAIDPRDPARADRLSTAEWMKRRNAQAEGAGARR